MTGSDAAHPRIDTSRPHPARVYDWWLGGKDNYPVDEELARRILAADDTAVRGARANRRFMHRATRTAAEAGIRQFLDIGTGIPTEPNLHQVAQSVVPDARVVYADNDPLVLKYAERLMRSTQQGRTAYVQADVNDPDTLLNSPEVAEILDFDQPIALSLNALLHFVTDDQDPYGLVERLVSVLPSGSALAISHVTADFDPEPWAKVTAIYEEAGTPVKVRSRDEVARFFTGLDLLEPGIAVGHRWRPAPATEELSEAEAPTDAEVSLWTGVGIKP